MIATTFTLIAVFLPTAFMSGVAGKFFKQFGWTASLAVFASLVVARVLTPMMAAYLLKPIVSHGGPRGCASEMGQLEHAPPREDHGARDAVLHRLGRADPAAAHRLHPPDDNSQTQVYLELPPGSTLQQTRNSRSRRDWP